MRGKTSSITSTLNNILKQYNMEKDYKETFIKEHWNKLLNSQISKVSKPVSFNRGLLTLEVESKQWKQEFKNNKESLLKMINESFGNIEIKDIGFI